jgi:hypothetical protein
MCHGSLHYDRKFQIFRFLIGHINVNKGVFCLIISYLQIKNYNVLNYNNCSTNWPFPLTVFNKFMQIKIIKNKKYFLRSSVTDIIREVLVSDTCTEVFDSKCSSV